MQKYIKIYCDYFDCKFEQEVICECCGSQANDVYHIYGRGKDKEIIENLMALCRRHHLMATESKVNKDEMQLIHNYFMQGQRKIFIK